MATKADKDLKMVTRNRKAFHEYAILETFEAGMALQGTEVKSLRAGTVDLKDSYAEIRNGEVYLVSSSISPYAHGTHTNHLPERERKLLLHRREIQKLAGRISEKGLTLIPLGIYFKKGIAKVEIGLARGKKLFDKREAERRRTAEEDMRERR